MSWLWAKIPSEKKFCGECGQVLDKSPLFSPFDYKEPQSCTPKHLAEKILTTRSTLEGERKLVTVMFADVAGFTGPLGKAGPGGRPSDHGRLLPDPGR